MNETESKFVARELTVLEMIYFNKGGKGDFEFTVMFVESRLVDKSFNVRELPLSDWNLLLAECMSATWEAIKTTQALAGKDEQPATSKAPIEQIGSMIAAWGKGDS
jgi:hypothetical protein